MNRSVIAVLGLLGSLTAGCSGELVGTARVPVVAATYYTPSAAIGSEVVFVEPPALVTIDPGISVVENYGHAVYYAGGAYWYPSGGAWYHAAHWNEPWARVEVGVVPLTIVHRDHHSYEHYRARAGVAVWREPRATKHAVVNERVKVNEQVTVNKHVTVNEHVKVDEHVRVDERLSHHPTKRPAVAQQAHKKPRKPTDREPREPR